MEKHYILQFEDDRLEESVKGSLIINEDEYKYRYSIVEQAVKTEDYSKLDKDYMTNIWVSLANNSNIDVRYKHITDLMNQITCTELTNDEYNVLMKFGFNDFGPTNFWHRITEAVNATMMMNNM